MVKVFKRPKVKFKQIASKIKVVSSNGHAEGSTHEDLEDSVSDAPNGIRSSGAPSLQTRPIAVNGETPIAPRMIERSLPREASYVPSSSNPYAASPESNNSLYDARPRASESTSSRANRSSMTLPENAVSSFNDSPLQTNSLRPSGVQERDDRYSPTHRAEAKKEKRYAWEV